MSTITYLSHDDITAIRVDDVAPGPRGDASGYGTHATRYRLLAGGRWRRVYADVFGNSGVVYVRRDGQHHYLGTEAEAMVEGAAQMTDRDARHLATDWQSPGAVGSELATLASTGQATDGLADDIRATIAGFDSFDVSYWQLMPLLGWALAY